MICAIDTEDFYSKNYSIRDLGNHAYVNHPEFHCYMLTVATDQGDTWCGAPEDFNWPDIEGAEQIYANAGFDLAVIGRLAELGKIPKLPEPPAIYDVLDLARYLGFPGNLAGAALHMLGETLDKGTRDRAKGKHWNEMSPDFQAEMRGYAVRDAVVTLKIFQQYGHLWPENERELARITREMCVTGIPVDLAGIDKDIEKLETLLWKVRTQIPWEIAEDGKGALSKKSLAIECRKIGIEPPKSMAKDSALFDEWLRQHGDAVPFARAMGSYRSINGQLKRLHAMRVRSIETGGEGEGVMKYGLKYFGGHLGRDSGDAGVNVQNFSRKPMFEKEMREVLGKLDAPEDEIYGIDMRGKLMAPEGYTFGIVDLSAIEPCVLATLAEDWETVKLLKSGMDPYEVRARRYHGYTDPRPLKEVDFDLRQLCKVETLGLGYGAGSDKLRVIAKDLAGLILSDERATQIVFAFRATKFIPKLWNDLEASMRSAAGGDYTIELPSGRIQRYRDVQSFGSISAVIPRGANMMRMKWWGGSLAENVTQGAARDVFMDRVLALHADKLPPVLRSHDEAVCLLKDETAEDDLARMIKIMSTNPTWWPELPLRADGFLSKRYKK